MTLKDQLGHITFKTHHSWDAAFPEWRSILPQGHHLLWPDLRALEFSELKDLNLHYVTVFSQGNPIGVMYLQSLRFNRRHYRYDPEGNVFMQGIRKCLSKHEADILVCGNLFRVNFQGFYFAQDTGDELIFPLLLAYRKQLGKTGRHCGILLKDCFTEYSADVCTLQKFKPFHQDITMELSIRPHWKSLEHYLDDLSRKYRQRAHKILKSAAILQVRDLSAAEIELHKNRLERLYLNIVEKQSISPGILNGDYFLRMKQELGPLFSVKGYFENGELLAFSSQIYYPETNRMEIHYIGLDYAHNNRCNLYFNILFEGIRTAIESGYTAIEMGRTAREAKASAGAVAVENHNYIWLQAGIIRLVFNMMSNWYSKNIGEDWKNRNPFKTSPGKAESQPAVQMPEPFHSI